MKHLLLKPFKYLALACALLFLCTMPLKAAGPVTQALLTDYFFRIFPQYSDSDQNSFRAGALFPDIYLLGCVSQDNTYFANMTLEDILTEPSPFTAGMKFHSLVEDLREAFILQGNYYQLLSNLDIDHPEMYLQFLEDQLVFPSVNVGIWKTCVSNIQPEETAWNIDPQILKRWHYLLDLSFSYYPSTLIFLALLKGNGLLGVSSAEIGVWNGTFEATSQREDIQAYVNALFNMFASQVSN